MEEVHISAMHRDPFITRELQAIEQIVRDETWLEGERRRNFVSPDDPVVRENVCRVILRIGAQLRESLGGGESQHLPAQGDRSQAC